MRKTLAIFSLALALGLSGAVTASTAVRMNMEPAGSARPAHDCPDMAGTSRQHRDREPCTLKCALACHYLSTLLYTRHDLALTAQTGHEYSGGLMRLAEGRGPQVPTPPPDFD